MFTVLPRLLTLVLTASAAGPIPTTADAPAAQDIVWQSVGPGGGGWIESIAWATDDADRLYVGCDVGGFYLSTDAGRSYRMHNEGLNDRFVERIVVSPRDPQSIWLATESGLHHSRDGGRHWSWVRAGFPPQQTHRFSAPIGALAVDPLRPQVIYAGIGRPRWHKDGSGTIYRSTDGGTTWQPLPAGQLPPRAVVNDLAILPGQSRVLLAATNEGLFRSDDEGATWKLPEGLPPGEYRRLACAATAEVVYVSRRTAARDGQAFDGGVFRSDDGGRHWRSANGEGLSHHVGKKDQPEQMTSNIDLLAVDPRNADVVYAGDRSWVTAGVYKTGDGGRHWQRVTRHHGSDTNMEYGWITMWGPAVECLAIDPLRPDRVAFGTSGHVFTTDDGGQTWRQRYTKLLDGGKFQGTGLEVTCLNALLPDPRRPQRLYACYMDIGLLISDDLGQTFRRDTQGMKHPGNCFAVAVDPLRPETIWAGCGEWGHNSGDVCLSHDDGRTWSVVGRPETGLPDGQTRHLVLDLTSPPEKRRVVVTCKGHGIYATRDGGQAWQSISGNLPEVAAREPRGLWLDPQDPRHLFVALDGAGAKGGGVYATTDGGQTWTRTNRDTPWMTVMGLAVDPAYPSVLYVATREAYDHEAKRLYPGGVFKSADGGATWSQILSARFASAVAVSPRDSRTVYVATTDHPYHDRPLADGLLKSTDGGLTWQQENTGLPNRNISCVSLSPHDPHQVLIGTGGNGAFIGRE